MKKKVLNTRKPPREQIRLNYSHGENAERMRAALQEAKAQEKPNITRIADLYQVARKSLDQRVKGNVLVDAHVGNRPYLSAFEEDFLVNFLEEMSLLGFGYAPNQVCDLLRVLFHKPQGTFTRGWYYHFMSKNPQLALRKAEALDRLRNQSLNNYTIQNYFEVLLTAFEKCQVLSGGHALEPQNIFAMDETGIDPSSKVGYVIAPKGAKLIFSVTSESRKHLTLVSFACANGWAGAPMLITAGKAPEGFVANYLQGARVASTKSGYISESVFGEWCSFFVQQIRAVRGNLDHWCLLILDGHSTHTLNPAGFQILNDAKVLAICLPSHSTSLLQVHDLSIFGPLKKYFSSAMSTFIREHGPKVDLKDIPQILEAPWERANSLHNIKSGFRKAGVAPLDLDWMEKNKAGIDALKSQEKIKKFEFLSQRISISAAKEQIKNLDPLNLFILGERTLNVEEKKNSFVKRSLSGILLRVKERSEPLREAPKRTNMIDEPFSTAKILNEPPRIEMIIEAKKKKQKAQKRKADQISESQISQKMKSEKEQRLKPILKRTKIEK